MAKVSGKEVAEAILKKLEKEIQNNNLHPGLAIVLANNNPASRIYVNNKIKAALRVGVDAKLYEFSKDQAAQCLETIKKLDADPTIDGIIVQYPVYEGWDFDKLEEAIAPQKDVDGFRSDSLFSGATALGVWEMLTAYSLIEGFKKTEDFLMYKQSLPFSGEKGKKIVVVGRGKAAGGPIIKLLKKKGFTVEIVDKQTKNPDKIIKSGDVVISATGVKNIINKNNLKWGSYVVGVGIGKELIEGKERIYGDINEEEVSEIAKLYNPNLGGIGPLTIVSLLKNVVKSASSHPSS